MKKEIIEKSVESVVPEIYHDVLQPAAKEVGKIVSLPFRGINAVLSPLWGFILTHEYKMKQVEAELAKKLENVSEDDIVTPEAYVAVPALQSITYCMNSQELRNLYGNLLAHAIIKDFKAMVHPAFVEIIKQMSPNDAKVIQVISKDGALPVCSIRVHKANDSFREGFISDYEAGYQIFTHYALVDGIDCDSVSISISNLSRLGLIEVSYEIEYEDKELYKPLLNNQFYQELKTNYTLTHKLHEYDTISLLPGTIEVTPLGHSFINICVKAPFSSQ